jgi:hypothetical protein
VDHRQPPPGPFRLLSEVEFNSLTTAERIEYLKNAVAFRDAINEQVERALFRTPDQSSS